MAKEIVLPLNTPAIEEIIPHRYPFLFIDQVVEFLDGDRIVGIKNITANEPQFTGHFPGRPVMPGVLMLEALAQLGAIFARLCTGGAQPEKLIVFSGADDVRFRRVVVPGDRLKLQMALERRRTVHWRMRGTAWVGEDTVCEAFLMATEIS